LTAYFSYARQEPGTISSATKKIIKLNFKKLKRQKETTMARKLFL
jgi:hypothetical protein